MEIFKNIRNLNFRNVKMTSSLYGQSFTSISIRSTQHGIQKWISYCFFNYSEICDCSVFNLNHYLLLSYSRMNKVIKRKSET